MIGVGKARPGIAWTGITQFYVVSMTIKKRYQILMLNGPTGLIEAGINALQKNEKVIDEAKDKGQEPAKIDEEEKTPNETTFGNLTKSDKSTFLEEKKIFYC